MDISTWSISKFVSYRRSCRKNDHAVERMAVSINEFGFKIPILARSNGEVVDGHLRLKAAIKLGIEQVPVILCDEWSEPQVKAFRLLVNRSATWADWDMDAVALEITELKGLDFDLNLTGFDRLELDQLLNKSLEEEPEGGVLEPPEKPATRRGDIWICGSHRILCGDATSADDVSRLLGSATPLLMVTDPPYGVEYDPLWREKAGLGEQRQTGTVANDDRVDWTEAYRLFPGDIAYVWHAGLHAGEVAAGLESVGFRIRSQIIWAKQNFALSRGDYHWQHEPCWYAVRDGKPSNWSGDRTQSTLWQIPNLNPVGGSREEEATGHGTQKPVELMRRPICNHTDRGGIVYDCFLGSGSTLIAAESAERICYGLDIDARYVDVVVQRWQKMTGRQATLGGEGRSFTEIAAERCSAGAEV